MAIRNAKGQMERDIGQAALDAEAAELRAMRWSYPAIAAHQGCAVSTAFSRVKRAIASVPYEAVDELRRVELDSLDELERKAREVLLATHLRVDHGKVIEIDGVPMVDDEPVLRAAQTILRIKDMRAKLTGEYAPSRSRVEVVTEDVIDAEIRALEQELARNADSQSGDPRPAREAAEAERA